MRLRLRAGVALCAGEAHWCNRSGFYSRLHEGVADSLHTLSSQKRGRPD